MKEVVLVCSKDGRRWNFPRGKIEEGEGAFECSIREVEEETGFNPRGFISPEHKIEFMQGDKPVTLFIGTNVSKTTVFAQKTAGEISEIQFFSLDNLPENLQSSESAVLQLWEWIRARTVSDKEERAESAELTGEQSDHESKTDIAP